MTAELDRIFDSNEQCRIAISEDREIQLVFHEFSGEARVDVTVTLPHGYPNKAPVVSAAPIEDGCPHRWPDGTLCIYGSIAAWNPGKHDVMHAVALFRRWMQHYSAWRQTEKWPDRGHRVMRDQLFARIESLFDVEAFHDLRVMIAGCGSGGGYVAQQLVMSGVKAIHARGQRRT